MDQQSQDFVDTQIRENSPRANYQEEDSGFKAWESEPVLTQNNTNLLRNLKSQLAIYEQKYRKLESNQTVPVKLPVLEYMRRKSHRQNGQHYPKQSQANNVQNQCSRASQQVLTERKPSTSTKQPLGQHKSIEINTKKHTSYSSSRSIRKQTLKPSNNQHQSQKYMFINIEQQNNQLFVIPKVQQMKFSQNQQQKRLRKRDLYLAIFGDRGKGKVQRIEFDDQNKAYKQYLQRKNQQMKSTINNSHHVNQKDNQRQNITIGNTTSAAININKQTKHTKDTKNEELTKLRCSSQVNTRYHINKPQFNAKSIKIMSKQRSHLPIRF